MPRTPRGPRRWLLPALALLVRPAAAHDLDVLTVYGRADSLLGVAGSAAEGVIGARDLAGRPLLRAGELLEVVPGAVVTQHSGTGKANQYFLRGFNLDHGTDFAGFLDGVPLNLPSHGHGQGYLDLNPIIPEVVESIRYGKGPYYADVGDFGTAGHARYSLARHLHEDLLRVGVGENGFYRGVAAGAGEVAGGNYLYGFEAQHLDGPWRLDENAHKLNGLLRHSRQFGAVSADLALTAYEAGWNATDQVPSRAVDTGLIPRLGTIDPTLGGDSARYSANLSLAGTTATAATWQANAYAVASDFDLYSNFTYLLEDPLRGDQIKQADRRWLTGVNGAWRQAHRLGRFDAATTVGLQLRHDHITDVALGRSRARRLFATVRDDQVAQTALGVHVSHETRWLPWLRSQLGLRADRHWFDVTSQLAANSGHAADTQVSPKASLALGPWSGHEFYLNAGRGFHSNDARGTVTRVDPVSGAVATPVPALVRAEGAEVGWRTTAVPGLHATVGLWYLELDSELVFVGDAGATEPSGASRRYGVEWSNHYQPRDWLAFDLDLALTQSELRNAVADDVPNSVGRVLTAGVTAGRELGPFGSLRLRHFGDSPLVEDGSVYADATTVVNLRAGYRFGGGIELALDVFNLFDSHDADISYYYASCLPSDPASACGAALASRDGVEDLHLHPVEPRQVRATLSLRY